MVFKQRGRFRIERESTDSYFLQHVVFEQGRGLGSSAGVLLQTQLYETSLRLSQALQYPLDGLLLHRVRTTVTIAKEI